MIHEEFNTRVFLENLVKDLEKLRKKALDTTANQYSEKFILPFIRRINIMLSDTESDNLNLKKNFLKEYLELNRKKSKKSPLEQHDDLFNLLKEISEKLGFDKDILEKSSDLINGEKFIDELGATVKIAPDATQIEIKEEYENIAITPPTSKIANPKPLDSESQKQETTPHASITIDANAPPKATINAQSTISLDAESQNKYEGHIPQDKFHDCMNHEKLKTFHDHRNNVDFVSNAKDEVGNKDPHTGKIVISITGKTTYEDAIKIANTILETKIFEEPSFAVTANDRDAAIALATQCQKDGITLSRIIVNGVAHEGDEAIKQFLASRSATRLAAVDANLATPKSLRDPSSNPPLTQIRDAQIDGTPPKPSQPAATKPGPDDNLSPTGGPKNSSFG